MLAASEEDGVLLMVALAKHEAQVLVLHVEGRAAQANPARDEHRLRVAVSERLEQLVARQEIQGELREGDLRIIGQSRHPLLLAAVFQNVFREVFLEIRHVLLPDREAGGHRVTAARNQVAGAGADRLDQRYAGDRAARALADAVFVNRDHKGGLVVLPHQTRGYDADHAMVPVPRAKHDHGIVFHVDVCGKLGRRLLADFGLHILPLAVVSIKFLCQIPGGGAAIGVQRGERVLGEIHASGGVDPWPDPEPDIARRGIPIHSCDLLQRT